MYVFLLEREKRWQGGTTQFGLCNTNPPRLFASPLVLCQAETLVIINMCARCSRRSGLVWGDGVDVEDGAEEVLDDLSLSLLASLLDALDLLLGFLVGFGLGLLVALAVLGLEFLIFFFLLGLVVGYLLLGLIASFPDALGTVFSGFLDNLGSILLSVEQLLNTS